MTESFSGTLAGSCGPTLLLLEVTSSFFFLASSFCCQWLWSWTVIRQMTHPSTGYSLKPTTLAQCLHIEQQALENICNYFKADEDFCSQPPDQLCLEKKKEGKSDASNYGLKVPCIGLLEIYCCPVQKHDHSRGSVGWLCPQWCNVTCSDERKPR